LANYVGRISFDDLLASIVPEELVELTNVRRDRKEAGELRVSSLLEEAAQKKADDMAEKGYFAHHSPEGHTPWHWFEKVGYDYRYAGENLAVNFTEAREVDRAWMESPTHRANIINERFEEIGIATAKGEYKGREATFVVQLFGKRSSEYALLEEEEGETTTLREEEREESILGEGEERETREEKDEKKESFAFMEKMGEERTVLTAGHPETAVMILGGRTGYRSFWERARDNLPLFASYFIVAMAGFLVLAFLLKKLFWRKLNLIFVAANEVLLLLVVLSGILTSHYVLQIFI